MTRLVIIVFIAASQIPLFCDTLPLPRRFSSDFAAIGPTTLFQESSDISSVSVIPQTFVIGTSQLSVQGLATTGVGIMNASADATFTGPGGAAFEVGAGYTDDITISFAPFTGSVGYLIPIFNLTGTGSQIGGSAGFAVVDVITQDNTAKVTSHEEQVALASTTMTFKPIPFRFGQAFALSAALGAEDTFSGITSSTTLMADFGHTAILAGLEVFDSNMVSVPNPSFTSALGADYSVNGVVSEVPEPSSAALLLTGIAALIAGKRWAKAPRFF